MTFSSVPTRQTALVIALLVGLTGCGGLRRGLQGTPTVDPTILIPSPAILAAQNAPFVAEIQLDSVLIRHGSRFKPGAGYFGQKPGDATKLTAELIHVRRVKLNRPDDAVGLGYLYLPPIPGAVEVEASATIVSPDGIEESFDLSGLRTRGGLPIFDVFYRPDYLQEMLGVPALLEGSVVTLRSRIALQPDVPIAASSFELAAPVPIQRASWTVKLPRTWSVDWWTTGAAPLPTRTDTTLGISTYHVEATDIAPLDSGAVAPRAHYAARRVNPGYLDFLHPPLLVVQQSWPSLLRHRHAWLIWPLSAPGTAPDSLVMALPSANRDSARVRQPANAEAADRLMREALGTVTLPGESPNDRLNRIIGWLQREVRFAGMDPRTASLAELMATRRGDFLRLTQATIVAVRRLGLAFDLGWVAQATDEQPFDARHPALDGVRAVLVGVRTADGGHLWLWPYEPGYLPGTLPPALRGAPVWLTDGATGLPAALPTALPN